MRISLASVALMLCSCAGQDLAALCDVANEHSKKADVAPSMRTRLFVEDVYSRVGRFGDTRKAFAATAMLEPARRYEHMKQAAKDMGHPEWECPALKTIDGFAPEVPRCAPWDGAVSFVVREQAGRGDFFREFAVDFRPPRVIVHDSDPFATGAEEKDPRVIKKEVALEGERFEAVKKALFAICPSEEARKRECAPGGCSRLEVADGRKIVKVDDPETVVAVMKVFAPLFPELRAR